MQILPDVYFKYAAGNYFTSLLGHSKNVQLNTKGFKVSIFKIGKMCTQI